MRKQFTFYRSFFEASQNLRSKLEISQFFTALCDYALNEKMPEPGSLKPSVSMLFMAFQPILETAHARSKQALTEDSL